MIYTCNSCRFTFKRVGKIEVCPELRQIEYKKTENKDI